MHLTIVAATLFEIDPIRRYLADNFHSKDQFTFIKSETTIQLLITGVGMTATAYALGQYLGAEKTDLLINAGIGGALNTKLAIGSVYLIEKDRFGDLGVEEADGQFTDIHELEMPAPNTPPYTAGWLVNPAATDQKFLPTATALTVQKVHGYAESIAKIKAKYTADIESMEGAAFHYAALMKGVPFFQIRAISNIVEPRNRMGWNIALAIEKLNEVLVGMVGEQPS